jgi:hypothetical protein
MLNKIVEKAAAADYSWLNLKITPLDAGGGGLGTLIPSIVNLIALVAGLIAFVYLVYSGFMYITAAGNEKNAEAGQKGITWAIIGIVIIFLSWAIVRAITSTLSTTITG